MILSLSSKIECFWCDVTTKAPSLVDTRWSNVGKGRCQDGASGAGGAVASLRGSHHMQQH